MLIRVEFSSDRSLTPEWFKGDFSLTKAGWVGPYWALAKVSPKTFTLCYSHLPRNVLQPLMLSKKDLESELGLLIRDEVRMCPFLPGLPCLKFRTQDLLTWTPLEYLSELVLWGEAQNNFDVLSPTTIDNLLSRGFYDNSDDSSARR